MVKREKEKEVNNWWNCTLLYRHDNQHNDTQHNNIQHNDTQHNKIQHNDTKHNDTQHIDIQPYKNKTQHSA